VYWDETGGWVDPSVLRMQRHESQRVEGRLVGPTLIEFSTTVIVVCPAQSAQFDRSVTARLAIGLEC
jgi:hypothetical protein